MIHNSSEMDERVISFGVAFGSIYLAIMMPEATVHDCLEISSTKYHRRLISHLTSIFLSVRVIGQVSNTHSVVFSHAPINSSHLSVHNGRLPPVMGISRTPPRCRTSSSLQKSTKYISRLPQSSLRTSQTLRHVDALLTTSNSHQRFRNHD